MAQREGRAGKVRIKVSRYGGFAAPAMAKTTELGDEDLGDDDSAELAGLLDEVDQAPQPAALGRPRPDSFHYEVEIERDGATQTLNAGESAMHSSLRKLVRMVEQRGKSK